MNKVDRLKEEVSQLGEIQGYDGQAIEDAFQQMESSPFELMQVQLRSWADECIGGDVVHLGDVQKVLDWFVRRYKIPESSNTVMDLR